MALWGRFPFSINTAAFQELNRETSWRWPSQELFGQLPLSQFVGAGDDTITLRGVIYPEFRGGTKQIEDMRDMASNGAAELLIDGRGNILGRWACTQISETQSTFAGFGVPLKQEFTMSLRRVPDPLSGNIITNLLSKKFGNIAKVVRMVEQIKSAAGQLQSVIQTARSAVHTAQAVIGAPAAIIISNADKAIRAGESIKDLAESAADVLGSKPTIAAARSTLQTLVAVMPVLVAQSTACSTAIDAAVDTVIENETPPEGVEAAQAALVAVNALTRLGSVSFHSAKLALAELPA
jgi:uncharacterized protein